MRNLIEIYDKLDIRNNSFVDYESYIKVKREMYIMEEKEPMNDDQEREEEKRFKLIDIRNNYLISWDDFISFETLNLLSKKNKVN
jgi:hypothetical protein